MFYLRNLSSQDLTRGLPWEFTPASPIPEAVRTDKKARDEWINAPATEHCVYTFNEGVNANLRISKDNPVHCAHALTADYDASKPLEAVLEFAKALPYVPNWIERTLSGNWRFVWLLEEPLIFSSHNFAKHFFKKFSDFAFDPALGMIGFDRGAWEEPNRCYTNSGDWHKIHDDKISADTSRGWLVKASGSFKFTDAEFGTAVPLDLVREELAAKYPRFASWPGTFENGSQGPSFWIDGSTSPKSAIVRETGIQTFAAHAAKGFYTWADLLGIAFVREFEAKAMGKAVENIFYDGRQYWRPLSSGSWKASEKADIALHLRVARGLSAKYDKSGNSDLDRALHYIQDAQQVDGAGPFVHRPSGIIRRYGKTYLNTSTVRVLAPADGKAVWGPHGQFPTLSSFFDGLYGSPDSIQLRTVLAWAAFAYQTSYHQEPVNGQVLFIAGPAGVGKTFLNRGVFGRVLGGFAEATAVLLGEDSFNADIVRVPYWAVDDSEAASTMEKMRKWGSSLKRLTANSEMRCNEKHRTASLVEWSGRLGVTCNADEESVLILPDLSISILDKLILTRTVSVPPIAYPPRAVMEKILDRELPWFARWLLDYQIPADLQDTRFGIKRYAESSLLETARQSSRSASFAEILDDWKQRYFADNPKAQSWDGTSYQLYKELSVDPAGQIAVRSYTVESLGRQLSALKNKGANIENSSRGELRVWRIHRGEKPEISETKNT